MSAGDYTPQPGTIPARVVDYFARHPRGYEVQTGVLVDELDQPSASITSSCQHAISFGLVACEKREGRLFWSRGPKAPGMSLLDAPPYQAAPTARAERRAAKTPAATRALISRPRPGTADAALDDSQVNALVIAIKEHGAVAAAPEDNPREDAEAAHASVATCGMEGATPNDGPDPQGRDSQEEALQNGTAETPAPGQRETAPQERADFGALADGEPWPAREEDDPLDEDRRARWRASLAEISREAKSFEPFRAALWSTGELELRRGEDVLVRLSVTETRELCAYLDRVLGGEGAEC